LHAVGPLGWPETATGRSAGHRERILFVNFSPGRSQSVTLFASNGCCCRCCGALNSATLVVVAAAVVVVVGIVVVDDE
jgi:hypothetical protein